jgi:hypothetical protein
MPEARKQPAVRQAVRERAKGRCEYCLCPDDISPAPFNVEHIVPSRLLGPDTQENLAWACGGCNGSKGIAIDAEDSLTGECAPLFHPRNDIWSDHFIWGEDGQTLEGRTPTGRATISRLNLNRPELLGLRRLLTLVGLHPP